jgi:predicted DCC family thiol-disulfide oxidoreductase YuxK
VLTSPGWTGGQFSLARALLGAYIGVRLGGIGSPLEFVALLLAVAFGLGWNTRSSGLALVGVGLIAGGFDGQALTLLGALLFALLFSFAPAAPYGSLERRGAPDPGTAWRMPSWIPAWMWLISGVLFLIDLGQLRWPLGLPHLLLLGPGWIPALGATGRDRVFYDGACGLCHGSVRFLIAEDAQGERFLYAPLDSEALRSRIDAAQRAALPDSIVVWTSGGQLLVRSAAILHLLERLGGWWRAIAWLGARLPTALSDRLYDSVARTRYRIFGTRDSTCPLLTQGLRERFET